MKALRLLTLLLALSFSVPTFAGSGTGAVTIKKITTYKNGDYKVYVEEVDKVNGRENCTATDGSLAFVANPDKPVGQKLMLSLLMQAKAYNKKISAFVVGCCKDEDGKQSPCLRTVSY